MKKKWTKSLRAKFIFNKNLKHKSFKVLNKDKKQARNLKRIVPIVSNAQVIEWAKKNSSSDNSGSSDNSKHNSSSSDNKYSLNNLKRDQKIIIKEISCLNKIASDNTPAVLNVECKPTFDSNVNDKEEIKEKLMPKNSQNSLSVIKAKLSPKNISNDKLFSSTETTCFTNKSKQAQKINIDKSAFL